MKRTLFVILGLLLSLAPAPARADNAVVSVQNFSFTPSTVTVALGQTVTWQFGSTHTSTSDERFWDSGIRSSGDYAVAFLDAGRFRYHCTMHPSMTGVVRVPMSAGGSAATGWRLRWSVRTTTPADRLFDVQYKRAGTSTWTWFRKGTAKRAGHFDPSRSGRYVFRARTRNVGVGVSAWSPRRTVTIG